MLRDLFASSSLHNTPYKCFPPPAAPHHSGPFPRPAVVRVRLGEEDCVCPSAVGAARGGGAADANTRAVPRATVASWEQASILYDSSALRLLDGGQFEWRDGRAAVEAAAGIERRHPASVPPLPPGDGMLDDAQPAHAPPPPAEKVHFIPFTWALFQHAAAPAGSPRGRFLFCSTHFEAGHDWKLECVRADGLKHQRPLHHMLSYNRSYPAKERSARHSAAARATLRARFGDDVPVFVCGDFNMQASFLLVFSRNP